MTEVDYRSPITYKVFFIKKSRSHKTREEANQENPYILPEIMALHGVFKNLSVDLRNANLSISMNQVGNSYFLLEE